MKSTRASRKSLRRPTTPSENKEIAHPYVAEPDVWWVKFMLPGVSQQTIPQGFARVERAAARAYHGEGGRREDRAAAGEHVMSWAWDEVAMKPMPRPGPPPAVVP